MVEEPQSEFIWMKVPTKVQIAEFMQEHGLAPRELRPGTIAYHAKITIGLIRGRLKTIFKDKDKKGVTEQDILDAIELYPSELSWRPAHGTTSRQNFKKWEIEINSES